MNDDAADAVRYAFAEPERSCGLPEWFVPRSPVDAAARRARMLERASAWFGSPVPDGGVRVTINTTAQPLLAALRQARIRMLGLSWMARDYPLRGAHRHLSTPKPLRAGLTGRHGARRSAT